MPSGGPPGIGPPPTCKPVVNACPTNVVLPLQSVKLLPTSVMGMVATYVLPSYWLTRSVTICNSRAETTQAPKRCCAKVTLHLGYDRQGSLSRDSGDSRRNRTPLLDCRLRHQHLCRGVGG